MIKLLESKIITVAMTGASGAQYGLLLLKVLIKKGYKVNFLVSKAAKLVLAMETKVKIPNSKRSMKSFLVDYTGSASEQIEVFSQEEWTSSVASGSGEKSPMVIVPCSTGTLSAIATGACNNLIERSADVCLKERRKLILVVRETPLSNIHLENMLKLSKSGVIILPASPGFYHIPKTVDDLIIFIVARILNQLDIDHDLMPKWGSYDIEDL